MHLQRVLLIILLDKFKFGDFDLFNPPPIQLGK